ncbi:hypothetical protein, partial [Devosia sp. MC521]|uniref:hypothetical protein n=1 Tax=Devosia sp. MC521 TaxID=2759954 RepID=UPI001AEECD20
KQPDLTGNPSMTTQPLARYGAPNGALASGLTTSVTPRPGTRPTRSASSRPAMCASFSFYTA